MRLTSENTEITKRSGLTVDSQDRRAQHHSVLSTQNSVLTALFALLLGSSVACANVLYVDDSAPAGGDGSSWISAMPHLQDALAAAAADETIAEIRVAQGVYRPDRSGAFPLGTGDRNASFALQNNLAILGGFRGACESELTTEFTENTKKEQINLSSVFSVNSVVNSHFGQSPDDRDIELFETTLHGDLAGDDGPEGTFINSAENAYQLIVAVHVDSTAVIDGFTVTSGRSDGVANGPDPSSRDQGTAVNVYFASPMILNCTFANNWTINHGTINDHGGQPHGMDNSDATAGGSTIINCTFRNNYSQQFGSGLYIHHNTATLAMGCRFLNNHAMFEGGGVYSNSAQHTASFSKTQSINHKAQSADSKVHNPKSTIRNRSPAPSVNFVVNSLEGSAVHAMIMNCEIRGNTAQRGAGIWTASGSTLHVIDCVVADNSAEFGGGMYNDQTMPTIMGCIFENNEAIIGGGGILNNFANATIHDCTFIGNDAGLEVPGGAGGGGGSGGGGIWNSGGEPVISHCVFDNNEASFGAGVYNIDAALPTIEHCQFTNNLASEGAGLYSLGDSNAYTADCMFVNNTVVGGAFPVGGGASTYFSNVTFERCCFAGNSAELGGGGMYLEGGSSRVLSCAFLDNHTTGTDTGWGGGLLNAFVSDVTVVNSLFAGNTAQLGGGFHSTVFTTASLINCTVVDNVATGHPSSTDQFGGGFFANTDTETSLVNCIVWNNEPNQVEFHSPQQSVRYSNVEGGFAGVGNMNALPMFVDADGADDDPATFVDNDYRVAAHSPCVDAGDTIALPVDVIVDLDGLQRVVDVPGAPDVGVPVMLGGPIVDMGAYEVQPVPVCPADIAPPGAPDGQVNIDDLLLVINNWGATGSSNPGDVDGSGSVDIDDLLAIVNAWGQCQ